MPCGNGDSESSMTDSVIHTHPGVCRESGSTANFVVPTDNPIQTGKTCKVNGPENSLTVHVSRRLEKSSEASFGSEGLENTVNAMTKKTHARMPCNDRSSKSWMDVSYSHIQLG